MADLTTLGISVLGEQDLSGAAELVIALDHLLGENGEWVVALAFIFAAYRCVMAWIVRTFGKPRRRESDAAVVVNTAPPPSAGLPPVPLAEKPPNSAGQPPGV